MQFPRFILHSSVLVILVLSMSTNATENTTIIVYQSGNGNFTSIQKAIDSVPSNNQIWTLIHVKAGIYNEKVNISSDKLKILLRGESSRTTVIQFGDSGDSIGSATFSLHAEDFVVMDIGFKNTYNLKPGNPMKWAPEATIITDRAAFYQCGFSSVQDTLTDFQGRHYFEQCYIEGAVDFIWGYGTSIYQGCAINITNSALRKGLAGYITAQGRDSLDNHSGFVFKHGHIVGTGPTYLGRAYRPYSRVIFYCTKMSGIILPEGWSAWNSVRKEGNIVYAEIDCEGAGSDKSKRVPWEKDLSGKDLSYLLRIKTFINQEGWIQKQPKGQNP